MASKGITGDLQLDCVDRPSPLVLPWFLRHTVANIFIITIEVSLTKNVLAKLRAFKLGHFIVLGLVNDIKLKVCT